MIKFLGDDGNEYMVQGKRHAGFGDVSSTHELAAFKGGAVRQFTRAEWDRFKKEA